MMKCSDYMYLFFWVAVILFTYPTRAVAESPLSGVPADCLLEDAELLQLLRADDPALQPVIRLREAGQTGAAITGLLDHLRQTAAGRYFFNWQNFPARFADYQRRYPEMRGRHARLAEYQMAHFAPETQWQLPFVDLTGDSVTAYQLRHLARQQKSADMALMFYYEQQKNNRYPDYFVRQMADLNRAFAAGAYDDAGNGIYERYRAGRRVQNWLFCHNAYLGSEDYTDAHQLLFLKTMLHHAAQLARRTERFSYGNHHTRGLVGLFEIAAFFPEFQDAEQWRRHALSGLMEHLQKEVNDDGFQFERSVHYHKGDIENYFRVYQLAMLGGIELPKGYATRFRKMFDALVNIARPNLRAPVLQDDTEHPYAENNYIDDVMAIGALLFEDSGYKYFASGDIPAEVYWLLREDQIKRFGKLNGTPPVVASLALSQTGYYVMRNGWAENSAQMVISAGLSARKPDHQHGEALSVTAFANGQEILPNYQVNYNIPGYRYWKNSWVKNVALVDSVLLGRGWRQNSGKSGFGKWRFLPKSEVIAWQVHPGFDYFSGSHDGFDSLGVAHTREILFIKEGFWIVRDRFSADGPHEYRQIWQGKYTVQQKGRWLRSTFADGSGLDIVQLGATDNRIAFGGRDGKQHAVYTMNAPGDGSFTTLLFPFATYRESVSRSNTPDKMLADQWEIVLNHRRASRKIAVFESDALVSLEKPNQQIILLETTRLKTHRGKMAFQAPVDLVLSKDPDGAWTVSTISTAENSGAIGGFQAPENELAVGRQLRETVDLRPGDVYRFIWRP